MTVINAEPVRTKIVPSNPLKADPTRSATLRRVFQADFARRFKELRRKIWQLVVVEDAFGINRFNKIDDRLGLNEEQENESNTFSSGGVLGGGGSHYVYGVDPTSSPVFNTRWRARSDPQKVEAFRAWLAEQIETDIIPAGATNVDDYYWKQYTEAGYRKGAGRAFDDTRKPALFSGREGDFFAGTKQEFLASSFSSPLAVDKVRLLAGRVFTDLKGVTEAMSTRITRELTDGLVQGQNPRQIARTLQKAVDTIGRNRALTIARTEIIRAHAEGQLDALEKLGVEEVGVAVEWNTAGDDRVCPLCQPLDGVVMKIKEARGILPRHPNCRCAFIPANVGESTKGQKKSKAAVQKAVDKSVRAEIPKRSKRTLATQKRRSPWPGAGKKISKKRPRSKVGVSK